MCSDFSLFFPFPVLHPTGHRAPWILPCKRFQKFPNIFCFQCHFLLFLPAHPLHFISSFSHMYESIHNVCWHSPWTEDTQWTRMAPWPLTSLSLSYTIFHSDGLTMQASPKPDQSESSQHFAGERHELLQTSWEVFWEYLLNYTHALWCFNLFLEIHLTDI